MSSVYRLALFSGVTAFTFVFAVISNIYSSGFVGYNAMTFSRIIVHPVCFYTVLVIRAFVCLTILGVRWPKHEVKARPHTLLGEMTTVGDINTVYNDDVPMESNPEEAKTTFSSKACASITALTRRSSQMASDSVTYLKTINDEFILNITRCCLVALYAINKLFTKYIFAIH
jgi:hypothetical protein